MFKKIISTRLTREAQVRSLFQDVRIFLRYEGEALAGLEGRAMTGREVWKTELNGHLNSGVLDGKVSEVQRAYLDRYLLKCAEKSSWAFRLLASVGVAALMPVLFAIAAQLRLIPQPAFALLGVMVAGGSLLIYAADLRQVLREANRVPHLIQLAALVITFVLASLWVNKAPHLTGEYLKNLSMAAFERDRAAFATDPLGFPALKRFAYVNFDVDVGLGIARESWAATHLALPGSSPASMEVMQGYCLLKMSRAQVLSTFSPLRGVDPVEWLHGVMMHELGHCLDIRRDEADFAKHKVHSRFSIAPTDADGASDFDGYMAATDTLSTQLWREALADLFCIGYWRLTYPASAARLQASLERLRSNGGTDAIHSTSCWIAHANTAVLPASPAALLDWADKLRASAPCPNGAMSTAQGHAMPISR